MLEPCRRPPRRQALLPSIHTMMWSGEEMPLTFPTAWSLWALRSAQMPSSASRAAVEYPDRRSDTASRAVSLLAGRMVVADLSCHPWGEPLSSLRAPRQSTPFATAHDEKVQGACARLLTPGSAANTFDTHGISREVWMRQARLPMRLGGGGGAVFVRAPARAQPRIGQVSPTACPFLGRATQS